jgi:multidrug efflux pump subunit AcrB
MWIVKIALNRPYTFIVLGLLILILSPVVILQTPTDIFPNIDIPVIAVSWDYAGLSPAEMEGRITSVYERVLTTTVDISSTLSPPRSTGLQSSGSTCSQMQAWIKQTLR